VHETTGDEWLDPHLFRIGASTLLNDLLMQRNKLRDGNYSSPRYVTND
jgi:deoxyribose-phosphate aldolase